MMDRRDAIEFIVNAIVNRQFGGWLLINGEILEGNAGIVCTHIMCDQFSMFQHTAFIANSGDQGKEATAILVKHEWDETPATIGSSLTAIQTTRGNP